MSVKLRPTAKVGVVVRNSLGEVIASPITHNALKVNVIHDFGKNLFSQKFSIRLGSSSVTTDYYNVFLVQQQQLANSVAWPVANNATSWTEAVVQDSNITWTTKQYFDIPVGSYSGTLRELGFNFYGDQSDTIHARAVLPSDLIIDETYSLEISYELSFQAEFNEINYNCSLDKDGELSTHSVTQRWSKNVTLWDIIGGVPYANNCKAYSGQLNGYSIEPDGYLGQSFATSIETISDTKFCLEARFDIDSSNSLIGIQSVTWETIPIKMSFNPPIVKTVGSALVFKISWELSQ